jgi:phospho-N-acetylmuramoyl-pentapeptide-transferase
MQLMVLSGHSLIRIFYLAGAAFIVAMFWTPFFTDWLYKNRMGKRIRQDFQGQGTPIFSTLHAKKAGIPTMGGILVWVTAAVLTLIFNLERSGTWLPIFALVTTGIVGAIDDYMNIRGVGPSGGGMSFRWKFVLYTSIAILGALWFYFKLDWNSIHIPRVGDFIIGFWYVPLFVVVLVFTAFAVNETDGLDGLAGGLLAIAYAAYAVISLIAGKPVLAAFCGTIVGALLAFLWFNIYPARFFMGDTGAFALGMTLAVVAFLTNSVVVLPIVTFVFVVEAFSFIIQYFSKKLRHGKKVFLSSPIHHHFEAIGWPETKITMRFWIIGAISAVAGVAIALFGRGF